MKHAIDETRQMWRDAERRRARRRELLEQDRIFTLANLFSLVRLALILPVAASLLMNRPLYDALALGLMVIAALTDLLDGMVARSRDEISQLGKIMDPVADKLFVGALGLMLVVLRGMPAWFVALFLARDVLILTVSYLLFLNRDIVMSSNMLGKVTTVVLMTALVAYTVHWESFGIWLVYTGSVLVIASGLVYLKGFVDLIKQLISAS
jgi:CDP-diacylglycerol--glycerol-3-phosphate 3-phosphatidyltransferase